MCVVRRSVASWPRPRTRSRRNAPVRLAHFDATRQLAQQARDLGAPSPPQGDGLARGLAPCVASHPIWPRGLPHGASHTARFRGPARMLCGDYDRRVSTSTIHAAPISARAQQLRDRASKMVSDVQDEICGALTRIERELGGTTKFHEDLWTREGGGGGRTRVIENGTFLEKGGVNVSTVFGTLSESFAAQLPGTGREFFATGISLVLHPQNPHVPTVHANFRHISHGDAAWVAGGADLTPYYLDHHDIEHFHGTWKDVCGRHAGVADYEAWREWCDRYFYLPHRQERRGIGGIFFDGLRIDPDATSGPSMEKTEASFAFLQDAARSFLASYLPIVERHKHEPFTAAQREWQLLRRGRYVEFNLLYDRGTTFGLRTGGRVESILMSLPAVVHWGYAKTPAAGSAEQALLDYLGRTPLPVRAE